MPGSDLLQAGLVQLHDVQGEVGPQAVLVELDQTGEASDLHQLHVVDQRVAVLPGVLARAAERLETDLLRAVQRPQSRGEHLDGVVNQRGLGLNTNINALILLFQDFYLDEGTGGHLSGGESFLSQNPVPDDIYHLVIIWVDNPESCDVCSSVFEILKINAV